MGKDSNPILDNTSVVEQLVIYVSVFIVCDHYFLLIKTIVFVMDGS